MSLPPWFDDTFILSLTALLGGGGTALLAYMLRSRCHKVDCLCIKCERTPIPLTAFDLEGGGGVDGSGGATPAEPTRVQSSAAALPLLRLPCLAPRAPASG